MTNLSVHGCFNAHVLYYLCPSAGKYALEIPLYSGDLTICRRKVVASRQNFCHIPNSSRGRSSRQPWRCRPRVSIVSRDGNPGARPNRVGLGQPTECSFIASRHLSLSFLNFWRIVAARNTFNDQIDRKKSF